MLKNAYTDVSVRRDGYPESICDRSTYMYTTHRAETKNVVCSYFPVGRYVSVHHVDDDDDPIAVCEIMVHGRPYTEGEYVNIFVALPHDANRHFNE